VAGRRTDQSLGATLGQAGELEVIKVRGIHGPGPHTAGGRRAGA
jgi:hypothetical protein